MDADPEDTDQLASLCALEDTTRRTLYDYVAAAGQPVNRDQASAAVGIDRSLAAYHLDRLVADGLLTTSFARPAGRAGPGAGRPAKYYQRAAREFAINIPPRDYRLAAEVFARAAESDHSGVVHSSVTHAATEMGRELAAAAHAPTDLVEHLRQLGFEPCDDDGVVRLRNCPFHQLAEDHTELVCNLNLAMLTGLTEALQAPALPRLDPAPGRCCVVLDPG